MSDQPLKGMAAMAAAGVAFVFFIACVKAVGTAVPAAQGAFLRFAFGLVTVIPALGALRRHWPAPADMRLFWWRGAVHTASILCWFFAMTRLPLAEVTAMNYLTPVCVTIGAAVFLGERFALRRMAAIAVAFLGVLIILRPGLRALDPGHLAMIGTALSLAASYVIAKGVSGRYPPALVVVWLSLTVTPLLAPFALAQWVPPSWSTLGLLALAALFANLGHYLMTISFQAAPVAVTQPVTFLQLLWSVLLGMLVFAEPLDPFVILGGGVIVAAVSFIAWREARVKNTQV